MGFSKTMTDQVLPANPPTFAERLRTAGIEPSDSDEMRLNKSLLMLATGLVCVSMRLWAGLYWLLGSAFSMNVPMLWQRVVALRAMGRDVQAGLFEDVPSYHIPTDEVAKLAKQAGVGELVLSHLIPPIPNEGPQVEEFVRGMNELYGGNIRVAKDTQRVPVTSRKPG